MARSTYIYLAWDGARLLGAFTVKHEMVSRVGLRSLQPINDRGWSWDESTGIHVQRVRDGELR
jgi:hypothetical protein